MSLFYSRFLWLLFIIGSVLSSSLIFTKSAIFIEFVLYSVNSTQLVFPVILDTSSVLFFSIVAFISANVLHFSNLYMEDEVYIYRLTYLVLLFIGSMAALILIPHITALLLGWDGLGLVSFLLVTFYASPKALGAGMFTALSNRIGDAMILISISLMYEWSYHLDLVSLVGQPVGGVLLMVAAMTKSAQFPLSSWLPAAMEAPTPVSALVHSSTLVTAGVYLMIRFYPFLSNSFFFNKVILVIGAVTSLFAGMSAMVELDLKKVIALSTLSQLGFMMMSIGLGFPFLAFFHLITHAMFKALLFICAGCLIHFHGHAQDVRQMGGISDQFPVTVSSLCVSSLALCAVPFMAGFYSKDAILEALLFSPLSMIVVSVAISSTLFTGMYSVRLLISGLLSAQKSSSSSRFCEPIIRPMVSLSFGAIFGGSMIVCMLGPLAFEPLSPFSKSLLTFLLFFGPSIVVVGSSLKKIKQLVSFSKIYYAAGSGMFFLTPLTSQKVLYSVNGPSRLMCSSDQSWFEAGQMSFWSNKSSNLMNMMISSGVMMVVGALSVF